MIPAKTESKLNGFAQQIPELSRQLSAIFDVSMDLENHVSWYCVSDPTWGGPPSKESLLALSDALRQTYMNIAALTGLDPCDQFEDSKQRIRQSRESRAMGK